MTAADQIAALAILFCVRAVVSQAKMPKKQSEPKACPLGKPYDEGSGKSKNGSGRTRPKNILKARLSATSPAIVIKNNATARVCFR